MQRWRDEMWRVGTMAEIHAMHEALNILHFRAVITIASITYHGNGGTQDRQVVLAQRTLRQKLVAGTSSILSSKGQSISKSQGLPVMPRMDCMAKQCAEEGLRPASDSTKDSWHRAAERTYV